MSADGSRRLELAKRRNALQIRAEAINVTVADRMWLKLGVANRHIDRIVEGILPESKGVVREIEKCLDEAERWLAGLDTAA